MSNLIEIGTTVLPRVRWDANVELRKARMKDVDPIYTLIKYWAERGLMLVRSHNHLYENLRDFFVLEDEDGHIVGSGALHILWHDIAEVRGLAIHPERQGQGLGRWIALAAEREAKDLGIPQIFAWTLQVRFFTSLGYQVTTREALPPKVFAECSACPFYDNCREIGVTKVLDVENAYKKSIA
ncbi:N-acetyltransferase [Meiothermus hypogaeus]|uniref:Acetyltransferase n=2 Tax=Meiothermus hypogaeus TaxID=884155 RepID=A0A511R2Q0_9DEIN|nr:N-acetyltransferase [Meiothermus hypogaeus]RIH75425.1 Amino-acid acetyltransferase [Meiothermus hypogaeus]GEM83276.1 acetyltransferase [Meiothermus hypogaeus NBRC 106114]